MQPKKGRKSNECDCSMKNYSSLSSSVLVLEKLPDTVTPEDIELYNDARKLALTIISPSSNDEEKAQEAEDGLNRINSIVFGSHEIETWYTSPFPQEYVRTQKLFFCEFCLKFVKTQQTLDRHLKKCRLRHPPGDEIYRCNELSIFEIDGETRRIYCQHLCLLSKLFLKCKTLYSEVELFKFYILTKNDKYGCHLVGYFSKQKVPIEPGDYQNLSCLMILPQYQKHGFGRLLIDFSYLLSRIEGIPGTPERPFTDFGRISYHSYWKSIILEYLHAHRDSETLKISDIAKETGMVGADIAEALHLLGFVQKKARTKAQRTLRSAEKIVISVDWDTVDAHMAKIDRILRISVDPKLLRMPSDDVDQSVEKSKDQSIWEVVTAENQNDANFQPCPCCQEPILSKKVQPLRLRKKRVPKPLEERMDLNDDFVPSVVTSTPRKSHRVDQNPDANELEDKENNNMMIVDKEDTCPATSVNIQDTRPLKRKKEKLYDLATNTLSPVKSCEKIRRVEVMESEDENNNDTDQVVNGQNSSSQLKRTMNVQPPPRKVKKVKKESDVKWTLDEYFAITRSKNIPLCKLNEKS